MNNEKFSTGDLTECYFFFILYSTRVSHEQKP